MRKLICVLLAALLALAPAFAEGDAPALIGETGQTAPETETITPSEPEPSPQPGAYEGWILISGPQGEEKKTDTLENLVLYCAGAEATILVTTGRKIELKDMRANLFAGLDFQPDPEIYGTERFRARAALIPPSQGEAGDVDLSAYKDAADEVLLTLYVWVEEIPAPQPTPEPTVPPEPSAPVSIGVAVEGYTPGVWTNVPARFTLSGIAQGDDRYSYAAILFDTRMIDIDGNVFEADSEGIYAVRFAILDEIGDILFSSDQYTIRMDSTPPESVSAGQSASQNYALVISASDSQSGVAAASIDGGATWFELSDNAPYGYKAGAETTFAPGMIQIRDAAGNIWSNPEPIALTKLSSGGGGGGGGGGGPRKTHSKNDTGNAGETEYAEAVLNAPETPVESVSVQNEQITASAAYPSGETVTGMLMSFTALPKEDGNPAEQGWAAAHTGDIEAQDDALILSAPEALGEAPASYSWHFSGAAIRTLSQSDIPYIVFRAGDTAAVLPTAGFTLGTKYTDLKIAGMSSRKFLYTVTIEPLAGDAVREPDEVNLSADCLFRLTVDIEDESYVLVEKQSEEMYAEGVYCIPADMLEYPYGTYGSAR